MPAWLLALLLAAFALYTDDYVIAGVLPEIAADLEVSDGVAGQLVTVFSATVAVAAPVAGVVLARVERRRIFAAALTVFVTANVLAALTPSFTALVVLRVLAALAAAAATPSLFAVAASRAPEGRRGRYLAVISLGVTGSITVGVPAGTWVGGAFGWRATFLAMAALGALSAVAILSTLPRTAGQVAPPSLPAQLRVLTSAPVALGLVANGLLITGSMMLLTYLAPFLTAIAAADIGTRGALFAAAGIAGTLGVWAGGVATDRWGADRSLAAGIAAFLAVMAVLTLVWTARPVHIGVIGVLTTIWAGSVFWCSPAVQARLHDLAGGVAPQALAVNTSATYLGVALGGAVGGPLLTWTGAGALPIASALFGLAALLTFALAARAAGQHSRRPPQPAGAAAHHPAHAPTPHGRFPTPDSEE